MHSSLITRLRYHLQAFAWRFKTASSVKIKGKSSIHKSARMQDCSIFVSKDSYLEVGEGCVLSGVRINLTNGARLVLKSHSRLIRRDNAVSPIYKIKGGSMVVGEHSVLALQCVRVRFGGELNIGHYVSINEYSEIRSDERVSIGDYGMISYYVRIWDTNVHCLYSPEKRKEQLQACYPNRCTEKERPDTAPVTIGEYVWLGERTGILKGCQIGNNVIVGFNAVLINRTIPDNMTVVQKPETILLKRNP